MRRQILLFLLLAATAVCSRTLTPDDHIPAHGVDVVASQKSAAALNGYTRTTAVDKGATMDQADARRASRRSKLARSDGSTSLPDRSMTDTGPTRTSSSPLSAMI